MSPYVISFITALVALCGYLGVRRQDRLYWAAACITGQTILLYGMNKVLPGFTNATIAGYVAVYFLALISFLQCSVMWVGGIAGILAAVNGIICVAAYMGFVPTTTGSGFSFTVWHWTTIIEYGQMTTIFIGSFFVSSNQQT